LVWGVMFSSRWCVFTHAGNEPEPRDLQVGGYTAQRARRREFCPIYWRSGCSLAGRPDGEGTIPPGQNTALRVRRTDRRTTGTLVATRALLHSARCLAQTWIVPPADSTLTPAHWCRHAGARRPSAAMPRAGDRGGATLVTRAAPTHAPRRALAPGITAAVAARSSAPRAWRTGPATGSTARRSIAAMPSAAARPRRAAAAARAGPLAFATRPPRPWQARAMLDSDPGPGPGPNPQPRSSALALSPIPAMPTSDRRTLRRNPPPCHGRRHVPMPNGATGARPNG
jgi:hypothetical protein